MRRRPAAEVPRITSRSKLRSPVYGVDKLRIADGPRVTTGNTMAPCVIIGERAAEVLRTEHKL